MQIPNGAVIAVVDGQKLNLFHNKGDEAHPALTAVPAGSVDSDNHGSGARHHTSSANPDHGQVEEDGHRPLALRRCSTPKPPPGASTSSSSSRRHGRWASCASISASR